MSNLQNLVDELSTLTIMEASELAKLLEEKWGVSAAAVAVAAPAGGVAAAVTEEKTEFTVVLTEGGSQKINVIKEIRVINSALGLKEAKDLVDGAPKVVKEGVSKEEAQKIKAQLEAAGAKVELK